MCVCSLVYLGGKRGVCESWCISEVRGVCVNLDVHQR